MKKFIDELGPIGIVGEAFKIFRTHAKVFLLIQLTLVIDVVALGTVGQYFLLRPEDAMRNGRGHAWRGPERNLRGSFGEAFHGPRAVIDVVTMVLVSAVFGLVFYTALSLSLSATLYSVALHYAGRAVSFVDVIRASVPRLWMRLALTTSYNLLLGDAVVLVQTVVLVLLAQSGNAGLVKVAGLILAALSLVVSVSINTIFTLAQGVAVFEEDYGWAAVRKGLKLLKGKVKVAILLQLLMLFPFAIQLGLALAFQYELRYSDFREWNIGIRIATVVVYIVWISFTTQLAALCYGVQYTSFNASLCYGVQYASLNDYHKSVSISDSVKRKKVGYESVGNGASEPLLGGQQTHSWTTLNEGVRQLP